MNTTRALWALVAVFAVFVVAEQCGDSGLKDAARAAEARADSLARDRAAVEELAATLAGKHAAIAAELNRVQDSLAITRVEARRSAAAARQAATDAAQDIRAALDSLGVSAANLDTMEEAHRAEIDAKDIEIDALETENRILWQRVQAADSLIAVQVRVNAALRREVDQLHTAVDLYRSAASPGFWHRLKHDVEVAAIGAGIGALGWELVR